MMYGGLYQHTWVLLYIYYYQRSLPTFQDKISFCNLFFCLWTLCINVVILFSHLSLCYIFRQYVHQYGIKVSILEPGFFATNICSPENIKYQCEKGYANLSEEQKKLVNPEYIQKCKREILHYFGV